MIAHLSESHDVILLFSAIGYMYYYPFAPAQTATFGLAGLFLLGVVILIVLIVILCRKPPPEDFREDETGDPFQTAFRQSYASNQRKKETFI